MFKFKAGDVVAHREGRASLGLAAGSLGVVWCLYTTDPPAYEVTFWIRDGRAFEMTVYENEVSATGRTSPVFTRPLDSLTTA